MINDLRGGGIQEHGYGKRKVREVKVGVKAKLGGGHFGIRDFEGFGVGDWGLDFGICGQRGDGLGRDGKGEEE